MDAQKLAKVLAMAASDNETEALHALRTARRLLDSHGTDFVGLAKRLAGGEAAEALEDAVFDLRNEVRQLRSENERLRQGRPATAAAVAPSFQDAARDAAELIRLRAELDGLRAEMLRALAHEATLQEQFRHALAEAGALGLRLSEAESRRLRLEAENRRLSHANHALRLDLAEAQALAPAANAVAVANLPTERNKGRKAAVSGKGRGQYALF
ncbi:MAG: Membrane protein related to [Rhodospirillaceae bacterium]|nr:MAG: Membrane protein related to [Rhodospirillaceae bacterium]TNC93928.1 MAG: Membrane protein related to metalloendopeptidase [Stygiobacter sp.]